jgi:hypothetical protein
MSNYVLIIGLSSRLKKGDNGTNMRNKMRGTGIKMRDKMRGTGIKMRDKMIYYVFLKTTSVV